jgi:hypothetical protein
MISPISSPNLVSLPFIDVLVQQGWVSTLVIFIIVATSIALLLFLYKSYVDIAKLIITVEIIVLSSFLYFIFYWVGGVRQNRL